MEIIANNLLVFFYSEEQAFWKWVFLRNTQHSSSVPSSTAIRKKYTGWIKPREQTVYPKVYLRFRSWSTKTIFSKAHISNGRDLICTGISWVAIHQVNIRYGIVTLIYHFVRQATCKDQCIQKWKLLTLVTEHSSPAWKTYFVSSLWVTGVMSLQCVSWGAVNRAPGAVPVVQTAPTAIHPITLVMAPRVIPRFAVHIAVWSVPVQMARLTTIFDVAIIVPLYITSLWKAVCWTVWTVKVLVTQLFPIARITHIMTPRVIRSSAVY